MKLLNDIGTFFGRIRQPKASLRREGGQGTEMQILVGHSETVRHLLRISDNRLVSCGDDGVLCVWCTKTGSLLSSIVAHSLPILCALSLSNNYILTGGADTKICIWDMKNYNCTKTLEKHSSGVQCVCLIPDYIPEYVDQPPPTLKVSRGISHRSLLPKRRMIDSDSEESCFCSVGRADDIHVWSGKGEHLRCISRIDPEYTVECVLSISGCRIVVGTSSPDIVIYHLCSGNKDKCLGHRKGITGLAKLANNLFASASIDGCILIWEASPGSPVKPHRVLTRPEQYKYQHAGYIHAIKGLRSLGRRYLAAASGKGFSIYNVESGKCIIRNSQAHQCDVNSIIALFGGQQIVSCAGDNRIHVWENTNSFDDRDRERDREKERISFPFPKRLELEHVCGLVGHTGGVTFLLRLDRSSFASCGSDGLVVLWKDSHTEGLHRNEIVQRNAALVSDLSLESPSITFSPAPSPRLPRHTPTVRPHSHHSPARISPYPPTSKVSQPEEISRLLSSSLSLSPSHSNFSPPLEPTSFLASAPTTPSTTTAQEDRETERKSKLPQGTVRRTLSMSSNLDSPDESTNAGKGEEEISNYWDNVFSSASVSVPTFQDRTRSLSVGSDGKRRGRGKGRRLDEEKVGEREKEKDREEGMRGPSDFLEDMMKEIVQKKRKIPPEDTKWHITRSAAPQVPATSFSFENLFSDYEKNIDSSVIQRRGRSRTTKSSLDINGSRGRYRRPSDADRKTSISPTNLTDLKKALAHESPLCHLCECTQGEDIISPPVKSAVIHLRYKRSFSTKDVLDYFEELGHTAFFLGMLEAHMEEKIR